jgi:hypothetical protein
MFNVSVLTQASTVGIESGGAPNFNKIKHDNILAIVALSGILVLHLQGD